MLAPPERWYRVVERCQEIARRRSTGTRGAPPVRDASIKRGTPPLAGERRRRHARVRLEPQPRLRRAPPGAPDRLDLPHRDPGAHGRGIAQEIC